MIDGIIVYNPDDLQLAIEEGEWKSGEPIIYRPQGSTEDEFRGVCSVLFPPYFTLGGFAFLIDEAGELQNAHGVNDDLIRVIKQHPTFPPEKSVMVIQTNHRLAEYNNSCKALLDELYIFQTTLPGDIETLEKHTGIPKLGTIVQQLPQHHCIRYYYGRRAGQQYEIWNDPSQWYEKISDSAEQHALSHVDQRSSLLLEMEEDDYAIQ
jgi:hypothetical protein